MNRSEQLEIAVQALRDIIDPIGKIKREMPTGAELNAVMAFNISNDPHHRARLAREALRRMGRRP